MTVHSGGSHGEPELLQSEPSRPQLPPVRAVRPRGHHRQGAVPELGKRRSPRRARGVVQLGPEVHGPVQRPRGRRGLQARERPGARARTVPRDVEGAVRRGLANPRCRGKTRRPGGPDDTRDDGRGVHVRLEHVVQHVSGAHAGCRRRDPRVRYARAAGDLRAEHVQRQVGRHDVPHRAARRLRRR